MNFLINKVYAVGTLTSADTETIIQNGIDSITENLIDNFPTLFVAMIVFGIFFGIAWWMMRAFRGKI